MSYISFGELPKFEQNIAYSVEIGVISFQALHLDRQGATEVGEVGGRSSERGGYPSKCDSQGGGGQRRDTGKNLTAW